MRSCLLLVITTDEACEITLNTVVEIIVIKTEHKNPNSFYINQNSCKYGKRFNQNKQYEQSFPGESLFRQNEYAAKRFYEHENSQLNRNQAHSIIGPTLQQDTMSYNAKNKNNVRWIQEEENNVDYFDAISDLFPLD